MFSRLISKPAIALLFALVFLLICAITRDSEQSPYFNSVVEISYFQPNSSQEEKATTNQQSETALPTTIQTPLKQKNLIQHLEGGPIISNHRTTIVVPRTKTESIDWLNQNFHEPAFHLKIYTVDDPETTSLKPPQNKGREAMVYLSYIIDFYDALSDTTIFIHPHQYSWHGDDTIPDTLEVLRRLNIDRVIREGYMNLRCRWNPGCPMHISPWDYEPDPVVPEQGPVFAQAWAELLPEEAMPDVLGQPCCSQFAVMRERIRSLPREKYLSMREWVEKTELDDGLSGRVFEYLWQYLFTGKSIVCPKENVCYCDGYGICFGGQEEFEWFDGLWKLRMEKGDRVRETDDALKNVEEKEFGSGEEKERELERLRLVREGFSKELRDAEREYTKVRDQAIENGKDMDFRMKELGK